MGLQDPFSIESQYGSIPLAFFMILALAALTEDEARNQVVSVMGAVVGSIAVRGLLPGWVYDYLALLALLAPLFFGAGLTYYGLGLPPIMDMLHNGLYIGIATTMGCILIPFTKMRFTDCQSMDVHLMSIPLVFAFILAGGAIAEPKDLESILTVTGVIAGVIAAPMVCPRQVQRLAPLPLAPCSPHFGTLILAAMLPGGVTITRRWGGC